MTEPQRLAAPAPAANDADPADQVDPREEGAAIADAKRLDSLFEDWAYWAFTRRYFVPQQSAGNILANLSSKGRALRKPAGGPDAPCSTFLAALHLAIMGQPAHAIDTQVFLAYYVQRTKNIKAACATIGPSGVSRSHFYRLLRSFCRRVEQMARRIEGTNLLAGEQLPHAPARLAA